MGFSPLSVVKRAKIGQIRALIKGPARLLGGCPEGLRKEAFDERLGGSPKPQKCWILVARAAWLRALHYGLIAALGEHADGCKCALRGRAPKDGKLWTLNRRPGSADRIAFDDCNRRPRKGSDRRVLTCFWQVLHVGEGCGRDKVEDRSRLTIRPSNQRSGACQ